jgi:hypothetical protein
MGRRTAEMKTKNAFPLTIENKGKSNYTESLFEHSAVHIGGVTYVYLYIYSNLSIYLYTYTNSYVF